MICPPEHTLQLFLDDRAGSAAAAIAEHLEQCDRCRRSVELLSLDPAVVPPPDAPAEAVPFLERLKRTPPVAPPSPADPIRLAIPGYALTRVIGRGGMGVVYEAVQQSLGRTVAVKVLADGPFAPPDLRERFRREGQVIARLHHPNVVQVIEVGEVEDTPYLVLEYVAGRTLADHLTGGPWAPRRAAELVRTVARAIHSAHRLGITHRDLKPANVLLDDGTPKVADFGLAGLRSEHAPGPTAHSHGVLGTPEYAAPEQLSARGPTADVYSLGAILYELLTGRPPFANASPIDTITQALHADPIPPARLERSVPRDVETVCLKCLEKNPLRRYPSADNLADDLDRFLAGAPVSARPIGQLESAARWFARHPVHLTLVATAVVLVAVCGLFLTLLWQSAVRQSAVERQARLDADERAATEERERRAATRRLLESDIDLSLALCEQGEVAQGLSGLRAVLGREDVPPELDHLVRLNLAGWRYRHATQLTELTHDRTAAHLTLTPDGSLLAVAVGAKVTVYEARTGAPLGAPLTFRTAVGGVRVAPDGGTLLAFAGRELMTRELPPHAPSDTATTYPADIADAAFGPAGKRYAVATADGAVSVAGVGPQPAARSWAVTAPTSVCFASADRVTVGTAAGTVEVIPVAGGEPRVLARLPAAVRRVQTTRTGRHVAVALANDSIEVLDADTGAPASRTLDPRRPLRRMVLPLSAEVVIGGFGEGPPHRRGECIVWSVPSGRRQQTLAFEGDVVDVAASADGSRLLAGGGHRWASVWLGQPWRPTPIRLGDAGFVQSVALDSGGRVAAVSHHPGVRQADPARAYTRVWELPPEQRTGPHVRFAGLFTLDAAANAPVVVVADRAGTVAAWDAAGAAVGAPVKLPQRAWVVRAHPDGTRALAATNRAAYLIDPSTGTWREVPNLNTDPKAAAFSATGRLFAVNAADGGVSVFRTDDPQKPVHTLTHAERVVALHFSDEARLAVCGMHGTVTVWDLPAGREVFRAARGRTGHAVAFSPDGHLLAFASGDRTLSLLDAETGEPVGKPILTSDITNHIAWTRDGRLLATGIDGTVRLYDAATRRAAGPAFPVSSAASAVAHAGDCVIVGEADGGFRGWRIWRPE